jgi:Holliday junction resolvasome RuvABC endonuclease subunit
MASTTLNALAPCASPAIALPASPPILVGTPVLLAIDLGAATGWALRTRDDHITSGTMEFRNDRWQSGGMRFLRFRRWLTETKHAANGIDHVVYEQVRRHIGTDAAHAYGGWLAILTAWCEHHEIQYEGVPVGTIKRFATGKGNAGKDAVIAAIKARGFRPADDNEADALAILLWAIDAQGGAA